MKIKVQIKEFYENSEEANIIEIEGRLEELYENFEKVTVKQHGDTFNVHIKETSLGKKFLEALPYILLLPLAVFVISKHPKTIWRPNMKHPFTLWR